MADVLSASQESDILPAEFKNVLTAEYEEIINTVQQVQDPYSNDEDDGSRETEILDIDAELQEQLNFNFPSMQNSILVVAPLQSTPSPTCAMPTTEEYPGPYGFEIQIDGRSSGKNWMFSYDLYKLFIGMNSAIHLGFKCDSAPAGLFVRALPVFCDSQVFQEPVVRCLHHKSLSDPHNYGLGAAVVDHIVRIENPNAVYECDEGSMRRSVLVALDPPQAGSDWVTIAFKFMCKNSCTSGMGRRPIEIIFTLENAHQAVLGRRKMKVRICSCPKRDKDKEEEHLRNNSKVVPRGKRLLTPSETNNPPAKMQKLDGQLMQIPVLAVEEFLDVTDYALSRLMRKLRIEKRRPTEREKYLLQKYKQDLATYE